MKIGVTGAAGFIGMHLTDSLLVNGYEVVGIDSLNPSYGGDLSAHRANYLRQIHNFEVHVLDVSESKILDLIKLLDECDVVVHLAAWPGVRQGQLVPNLYAKNNVTSFSNILEAVRKIKPKQFMYASSSSIYGDLAKNGPVRETDASGLNLKSYYAATKWMNEIEARASQELVEFPITALRFFTVYGPWGRPDMAYWSFLEKIKSNQEILLYGETGGSRNFTYIKDSIKILVNLIGANMTAKHSALNIACGDPDETIQLLKEIAISAKGEPKIRVAERPKVDVEKTWADLQSISELIDIPEQTPLSSGVSEFVSWYESYVK